MPERLFNLFNRRRPLAHCCKAPASIFYPCTARNWMFFPGLWRVNVMARILIDKHYLALAVLSDFAPVPFFSTLYASFSPLITSLVMSRPSPPYSTSLEGSNFNTT